MFAILFQPRIERLLVRVGLLVNVTPKIFGNESPTTEVPCSIGGELTSNAAGQCI